MQLGSEVRLVPVGFCWLELVSTNPEITVIGAESLSSISLHINWSMIFGTTPRSIYHMLWGNRSCWYRRTELFGCRTFWRWSYHLSRPGSSSPHCPRCGGVSECGDLRTRHLGWHSPEKIGRVEQLLALARPWQRRHFNVHMVLARQEHPLFACWFPRLRRQYVPPGRLGTFGYAPRKIRTASSWQTLEYPDQFVFFVWDNSGAELSRPGPILEHKTHLNWQVASCDQASLVADWQDDPNWLIFVARRPSEAFCEWPNWASSINLQKPRWWRPINSVTDETWGDPQFRAKNRSNLSGSQFGEAAEWISDVLPEKDSESENLILPPLVLFQFLLLRLAFSFAKVHCFDLCHITLLVGQFPLFQRPILEIPSSLLSL